MDPGKVVVNPKIEVLFEAMWQWLDSLLLLLCVCAHLRAHMRGVSDLWEIQYLGPELGDYRGRIAEQILLSGLHWPLGCLPGLGCFHFFGILGLLGSCSC